MTAVVLASASDLQQAIVERLAAGDEVAATTWWEQDDPVLPDDLEAFVAVAVAPDAGTDALGDLAARLDAVAAHLGALGGGRIVVVGASAALRGEGRVDHAVQAGGLIGIVRALTMAHAADAVTATLVLSGAAETEHPAPAVLSHGASVADVAEAVAFLCSTDAGYCNGLVLPVDGGASIGRT